MATENLVRISRKLRQSPIAKDGEVILFNSSYEDDIRGLSVGLREEVSELMQEIRAAVPSDFTFNLFCEIDGLQLSVDIEDGNSGSVGSEGGGFFTSRRSMLRKLRSTPWDKIRSAYMEQAAIYDEMLNAAEDRPVNIPSSEAAARRVGQALDNAIRQVQKTQPIPAFALILGDAENAEVSIEVYDSRSDVVYTIADRMTVQLHILAVLERGLPWSFAEIETAKLEAVEQLGPVSRAKAEGRFPY